MKFLRLAADGPLAGGPAMDHAPGGDFVVWARDVEPLLRQALSAAFGPRIAAEAAAEATALAWEQWERVEQQDNRNGYVYGIARNRARQLVANRTVVLPPVEPVQMPHVEPGLPRALERLSERQRTVVALVHGYGWSLQQAADVLGLSKSTIQNHLERGMRQLRADLGVEI